MKRLTILTALLALALGLGAATITVGDLDGTTYRFPIWTNYNYNYSQQIYKRNHINRAGEIYKIKFYRDGSSTYPEDLHYSHHWTIYMGLMPRNSFSSTTDWVPTTQLTQVFSGSVLNSFPQNGGWMEITLQTPFNYDNFNNLLVAVYEDTPGSGLMVDWGSFNGGSATGLSYYSNSHNPNPNNPPEACWRGGDIATMQLVFTDNQAPMAPQTMGPYQNDSVMNGYFLEWKLPSGSADATGYDVYIDGTIVSANQTATRYKLTGVEAGPHVWQTVARNQYGDSPLSYPINITVYPGVEIGNGNEDYELPINPAAPNNYSQMIYLKSEIDNVNHQAEDMAYCIEKITFYWNGGGVFGNSRDWVVYMGHTNRTNFRTNNSWIPTSQMVQVYSGQLRTRDRAFWAEVNLDTPFLYNNTDNLVIAVYENTPGFDLGNLYFHNTYTAGQNRSLKVCGWNHYIINPDSPPVGILATAYPNILIQTGELLTAPILSLSSTELDYDVAVHGRPTPLDLTVTNMGIGSLNLAASDISVIGPNADQFSFDPVNLPTSLGHRESANIPVIVTGITPGPISATLRIVYEGENYDVELLAEVSPPNVITIGDGTSWQAFPFATECTHSSSATLYKADEINNIGAIQMIGWDCNIAEGYPPVRYKIWAKNTTDTYMRNATWDNLFPSMTLLKQGTITFEEPGWQLFQLDTLFVYTGQNLIIAVQTEVYYGGYNRYTFLRTNVSESRHLYHCSNYSPPTSYGEVNGNMPNIMLQFVPSAEDDIGATRLSGNTLPIVGVASNYTVSLRNNGSNVQNNYQVKLIGADESVLASVIGPPINSCETIDVEIPWIPTAAGQNAIYGKVELAGDEVDTNNQTTPISVNVQPEGRQTVDIGSGDELARYPMDLYRSDYLYETIYTADELGITGGTIYSMVIYNQFLEETLGRRAVIYMGTTDQQDLSAGFIPASQLTRVFDGHIDFPHGANAILINLRIPFVYTGGNLVVMFHRPVGEYVAWGGQHDFRCQTGTNRGRYAHLDNIVDSVDPYNPPEGTLVSTYPMATFFFTPELLANDMGALYLTGPEIVQAGITLTYTLRIRNNGTVAQDNYQVKLMGSGNIELGSVAGPPLSGLQSLDVEFSWTPSALGGYSLYGKVEMDGDEITANNCSPMFDLMVYPLGVVDVAAALDDSGEVVNISWAEQLPTADPGGRDVPDFVGYRVYRLFCSQMELEDEWILLTPEPITELSFSDPIWTALPGGYYCWAIKAVYADGVTSLPGFSNHLYRDAVNGRIAGYVMNNANQILPGATVSNGPLNATVDSDGKYYLHLPVGIYSVTASCPGYISKTVENVEVIAYNITHLNFYLEEGSPVDDPQSPVAATALNGNYPNPFNPETTISYSVKEAGRVKVEVYNIKGQLVRSLVDEAQVAGHYKKVFDSKDNNGRSLSSGVYLIRMSAPGYEKTSKMMLMK
jgi:hypothetical protein